MAGFDVRRTAHHVPAFDTAIVHHADTEPVRVGVRTHFLDQTDDDVAQVRMQRLNCINRRSQHGEPLGHVFHLEWPPQELLEPTKRDVHLWSVIVEARYELL